LQNETAAFRSVDGD